MLYKAVALIIAVIIFLLNQWVNMAVVSGQLSFAGTWLATELSYHGIFSMLLPKGLTLFMQQLIVLSMIMLIGLFLFISTLRYSDSLQRAIVFGGLLGGTLSNLVYRYQHGYLLNTFRLDVADFSVNFNVADIAICFAILYFVVDLIMMSRQKTKVGF